MLQMLSGSRPINGISIEFDQNVDSSSLTYSNFGLISN